MKTVNEDHSKSNSHGEKESAGVTEKCQQIHFAVCTVKTILGISLTVEVDRLNNRKFKTIQ